VRAIVRSRDARSQRLDRIGAETVVADLFDVDQMLAAMRGAVRAYYCPPFHPYMIQSAAVFVAAARESKLEAIVGLSQWTASANHPSLQTRQLWLVEQMLSALPDIAYVNLNPGYFVDNYLRLIDFASLLGIFPILTGDGRDAPPSNEDIARVAVALLMDPDRYVGKRFRPTGSKLMSAYDMAVVTGASSGIGKEMALRLAEARLNLVLVARSQDFLEQMATDLGDRYGIDTRVVRLDLAVETGVDTLAAITQDLDVGLLVAAAGFGTSGLFLDAQLDQEIEMLNVNCRSLLALSW
jgi:hypothetical protein